MKRKIKVSDKKINAVKELSDLIKKRRTFLIASVKNLPASQLQEIVKKLREKDTLWLEIGLRIQKILNTQ